MVRNGLFFSKNYDLSYREVFYFNISNFLKVLSVAIAYNITKIINGRDGEN